MESLTELHLLFRRQNYQEIQSNLASFPVSSPEYPAARLIGIKSLMDQGLLKDALESIHDLQNSQSNLLQEQELLLTCLGKYIRCLDGDMFAHAEQLKSYLGSRLKEKGLSPYEQAICLDFQQRMDFLFIAMGRRTKEHWQDALQSTLQIVDAYKAIGRWEEAWSTLIRAARASQKYPFQDLALAENLLEQVIHEAKEKEDFISLGEAMLAKGELKFQFIYLKSPQQESTEQTLSYFQEAVHMLEKGHHTFPEAKVTATLGLCLLKQGVKEGVNICMQSIEALNPMRSYRDLQALWRSLHTWHSYRGNKAEAQRAREENERLSGRMKLKMMNEIDHFAKADRLFRKGEIGQALTILDEVIAQAPQKTMAFTAQQLASHMLGQVGRRKEAIQRLQSGIKILEKDGPTPLLGHTYFSLSIAYSLGERAGLDALDKCIEIFDQLGDHLQKGQYLGQRAWSRLQEQRINHPKEKMAITGEIEEDFEQAKELLLGFAHDEAWSLLASYCQMRGQAHFLCKENDAYLFWLEQAEQIQRQQGFLHSLAFNLGYKGLFYLSHARQGYPTGIKAFEHFQEAHQLFEETGTEGMGWRMIFYQGLSLFEEGGRGNDQATNWKKARGYLWEASKQIEDLKESAGSGASLKGQEIGTAFMLDKQTVFQTAFRLAYFQQKGDEMIYWLEFMKSQALIDALQAEEATGPNAGPTTAKFDWQKLRNWLYHHHQKHPTNNLLLLSFYHDKTHFFAFGMKAEWAEPMWERIPLSPDKAQQTIKDYFSSSDNLKMMLEDLGENEWQGLNTLITPLNHWSKEGDMICLVPYGMLHNIPLHSLNISGKRLIGRNPVCYLPSLSLLPFSSETSIDWTSANFSIFGDPTQDLPHARSEAQQISQLLGSELILGENANKERLFHALRTKDALHYAGHGSLDQNEGLESGLFLSKGEKLRARDLFGKEIMARLVVLNGCETGLSEWKKGDELFGLSRMLLLAGVPHQLLSLWEVSDQASAALMEAFYGELLSQPQQSLAISLQKSLLKVKKEMPHWNSLYYWSAFVLIGIG